MKEWFNSLQAREKQLVLLGAGFLAVLFIYAVMWRPFVGSVETLRSGVASAERNLLEMKELQEKAGELKALDQGTNKADLRGQSLLGVVDKTRQASEIPKAKRIEPDGKNGVRVWIDKAPFDNLVTWFGRLKRQYGVIVTDIVVSKEEAGLVNVTINMEGPAS